MLYFKIIDWLFTILLIAGLAINFLGGYAKTDKAIAHSSGDGKGKLVLFTSAYSPPYAFRDTATGNEIIGYEIDIAKYIAKELGFELEIRDTDFTGIIPALQSGRADLAMDGMTPTAERQKNVDFSDIYYKAKTTIIAKKGSDLTKLEDLPGKTVGVLLGTTQQKEAEKLAEKVKGMTIKLLNKPSEIIQEFKANRISAALIEDTTAKGFVASNPDLEINSIPNAKKGGYAIVFPKGSKLVDDFNRVLQEMKESGKLEKLVNEWLKYLEKSETFSKSNFSFARIAPSIPYRLTPNKSKALCCTLVG
jgi:polar amino acid transport system substrate-binding protein